MRGHGDCIPPAAVLFPQSPRRNRYEVESSCDSDSGGALCTRRCCGGTEYQRLFELEPELVLAEFQRVFELQPELVLAEHVFSEQQQQVLGQRLRRCFEQQLVAQQLFVLAEQLLVLTERGFAELLVFVVLAERLRRRELVQLDPVVLLGRHE